MPKSCNAQPTTSHTHRYIYTQKTAPLFSLSCRKKEWRILLGDQQHFLYPNISSILHTPLFKIYCNNQYPYFYIYCIIPLVFTRSYHMAMTMASSWLTLKTCSNLNAKAPFFHCSAFDPSYISPKIRYIIRYTATTSNCFDFKIWIFFICVFVQSLGWIWILIMLVCFVYLLNDRSYIGESFGWVVL